jgi:hypothetical protein
MAITTLDGYIAAAKQNAVFVKTAARTSIAATWFSIFDLAGNPGAGTLNVGNTANGLVPTDATAGFPVINAFGGGTGYLSVVDFGNTIACRMLLYDRLFHAGAYAFNANTTLATQPSYSSRVPSGTDFTNTQIWIECVTAFTGNMSVAVTYTNQAGTAARTTGTVATGTAPTLGRMIQLPLQAGDSGVQKIESVVGTVATVGTFNVLVIRPLWSGRVRLANDGDVHALDKTGMPIVWTDSALQVAVNADSTSTGIPELNIEIVNG